MGQNCIICTVFTNIILISSINVALFSEAVDLETTKIMLDFGVICFWIFVN